MDVPTLATEARKKGIQLLGTGDCLHPGWLRELRALTECNGILSTKHDFNAASDPASTQFILTVEVEDMRRVHHLLIVPSISKAEELYEAFQAESPDITTDGRPSLRLSGAEIADYASDAEALIGPCHAFTPWTALYAYHNSLRECYGDRVGAVSFVELGLSADTSYADRITDLHHLTFLTNSDAHSPYPIRLAREFNRFELSALSFEELRAAIKRERGRKPVLNVGFPPEEGKYNESACIRCFTHYTLKDAVTRRWRCDCGGLIKKGVRDRVTELADCDGHHPAHRPPYLQVIPLAEIIGLAVRRAPNSRSVQALWDSLLAAFGSEVTVLVDAPLDALREMSDPGGELTKVVEAIEAFRAGQIRILPGGGGRYGVIQLAADPCGTEAGEAQAAEVEDELPARKQKRQLSLLDF